MFVKLRILKFWLIVYLLVCGFVADYEYFIGFDLLFVMFRLCRG